MSRLCRTVTAVASALAACAAPAAAHHRQTPPVVTLTTGMDGDLPRSLVGGSTLVFTDGPPGARQVYKVALRHPDEIALVSTAGGDNANPVCARTGKLTVFDSDIPGPGRQLVSDVRGIQTYPVTDPDGTSGNATLTYAGKRLYFESTADFVGQNPTHARQVFHRFTGLITQVSRGQGTSGNAAAPKSNSKVAFDSTSHPVTGADTGIAQVWIGDVTKGTADAITNGLGDSTLPSISTEGRIVVFQSTADLANGGADTGVSQIFLYEAFTQTFAQLTNEPGGCANPSVQKVAVDYRVAYTCGSDPYFLDVRANKRFTLPIPAGAHTARLVTELGNWFLVLKTNGDLVSGVGTTPGQQVYIWNLYKRPATPLPSGTVTWFPFQGLPPI